MTISDDGKTIYLEVPIGGTVYTVNTNCNDACTHQAKAFREKFPDATCTWDSPCHTTLHGINKVTVSMINLGTIIEGWRTRYFPTEKEAIDFGTKTIKKHRKMLTDAGLKVNYVP